MPPEVAVVVPWGGDGEDLLRRQLQRLAEQDLDEPLSVTVAANSAAALALAPAVAALSTDHRRFRLVDATARRGPSAARNIGARAQTAELLLFCDADDEVQPGWARGMAEALRSQSRVVGGGFRYGLLNRSPFAITSSSGLPTAFGFLPFTPSASLGITRALFTTLGGFDERLTSGEDIDLCWRAQYAGERVTHVPDALIEYRLREGRELWRQGVRYGRNDLELYRLHRSHGFRRTVPDTARDLVRLAAMCALGVLGRRHRQRALMKLGILVGHVTGSLRGRLYFV